METADYSEAEQMKEQFTGQVVSKFALMNALATGGFLNTVANRDLVFAGVQSVEREDNSGKCWNVTGYKNGIKYTVFLKTLD